MNLYLELDLIPRLLVMDMQIFPNLKESMIETLLVLSILGEGPSACIAVAGTTGGVWWAWGRWVSRLFLLVWHAEACSECHRHAGQMTLSPLLWPQSPLPFVPSAMFKVMILMYPKM